MKETEIRKFRGKDVEVTFNNYKENCYICYFSLYIENDNYHCVANTENKNKEELFKEASLNIEKNLREHASGSEVLEIISANEIRLNKLKRKQETAKWFLDFTANEK